MNSSYVSENITLSPQLSLLLCFCYGDCIRWNIYIIFKYVKYAVSFTQKYT